MKRMMAALLLLAIAVPAQPLLAQIYQERVVVRRYPDVRYMRSIRNTALELERTTNRLYRMVDLSLTQGDPLFSNYDDNFRPPSSALPFNEQQVRNRFKNLSEAARKFNQVASRNFRNPARTETEFRQLVRAYTRAIPSLHALHDVSGLYEQFRRVDELMDDLVVQYGGYNEFQDFRNWRE
jgi:hypothetical protein